MLMVVMVLIVMMIMIVAHGRFLLLAGTI
jgi:hypothetical protein